MLTRATAYWNGNRGAALNGTLRRIAAEDLRGDHDDRHLDTETNHDDRPFILDGPCAADHRLEDRREIVGERIAIAANRSLSL